MKIPKPFSDGDRSHRVIMRLGIKRPKHDVSKQAEMPRVYWEASFQNLVD